MEKKCSQCGLTVPSYFIATTVLDGITLTGCPYCGHVFGAKAPACGYDAYLPTVEECDYGIYSLQKQLAKVQGGAKQLESLITKMEVYREIAKEKECKEC